MQNAGTIKKRATSRPICAERVRAFRGEIIKPAPKGESREEAFGRLRARIDETARRAHSVPDEEIDAAIDEAAGYVRHGRG